MSNEQLQNNINLQEIVKKEYVENNQTLCFDTIPIYKIIILTLVTCGLYEVILFYSWWKKLKVDFGHKVSPFWRALFSGFSVFWLFPIFEKYFKCYNIAPFNAGMYATLFFMCCWASNQLSAHNNSKSMFIEIVSWLFIIGITAIMVNVQTKINTINERYYPYASNNNWKISNTIWTIIFLIIFIFSIIPQPNNIQENNIQNTNVHDEQITDTQTSYHKQENVFDTQSTRVSNEKQQLFQHHMRMAAKKFTRDLESSNIKCGLSSSALAQCFARNVDGNENIPVSGSAMIFMDNGWMFIGDGICKRNGNCNIKIISRNDSSMKATIPIYVNENGYISVE